MNGMIPEIHKIDSIQKFRFQQEFYLSAFAFIQSDPCQSLYQPGHEIRVHMVVLGIRICVDIPFFPEACGTLIHPVPVTGISFRLQKLPCIAGKPTFA